MQDVMRYVVAVLLLSSWLSAQSVEQPGIQYATYNLLLVPQHGDGMMVAIDKQQKIIFVPIPAIAKAVDQDGVSPVRYGDLLQLVRQLGEENQRLKAENDHLWKVAEHHSDTSPTVIVEQSAPPAPDPNEERREMRMMLLRSLLNPPQRSSTVNVNVTDCTRFPALCVGAH